MARLLPFIIAFGAGFFLAILLYVRREEPPDGSGGSRGPARGRPPGDASEGGSGAGLYRRTLWDVRGMLARPEGLTPERLRSAVEQIDAALGPGGPEKAREGGEK